MEYDDEMSEFEKRKGDDLRAIFLKSSIIGAITDTYDGDHVGDVEIPECTITTIFGKMYRVIGTAREISNLVYGTGDEEFCTLHTVDRMYKHSPRRRIKDFNPL